MANLSQIPGAQEITVYILNIFAGVLKMSDNDQKNTQDRLNPSEFIGREFGNITLISLIGQGAMGAVFIGFQKSLKRKVAVKIYPKALPESSTMRLRFRDEAEIVAVLNHPNIIPVFDMGETDDFLYIIMQLIEGEDLRLFIQRHLLNPLPSRRAISVTEALGIMIPVLEALSYAHGEGVIHRDIKPANILINSKLNRSYLADFGIASTEHSDEDNYDSILGTPLYIAPEQASGKTIDKRADIYSAGLVLFELLAGRLPLKYKKLDEVIRTKIYDPDGLFSCSPKEASDTIDTALDNIILKAIAGDREKRFSNCDALLDNLKDYSKKMTADENK